MEILTPEVSQFTITNPVVYSEFDSDLEGESLSFAERRMTERWENENLIDLTKIFKGQSPLVNMVDILSPIVHDEIQKLAAADMPEEQRIEEWSKINFPDLSFKSILIDNAHPESLIGDINGRIGNQEFFKEIVDRIARSGVIVSPDEVKRALLVRYVKDSVAVERAEAKVGIAGRFFSSIGNFYVNQMADPLTALGDLVAFEFGSDIASQISSKYAIKGITGNFVRVFSEAVGLASKRVAIINGITNNRRADVGLSPIPVAETFARDVFAGTILGAAFSGIFTDGAALLRNKVSAYVEKSLARRVVETSQDARGRYKHSTMTDTEVINAAIDAAMTRNMEPSYFKVDVTFPRISDPSVPDINRAFNNSIGSVMEGTKFSDDINGFFATRLSGWVGQMSNSELLLMSEGLAKAKTFSGIYANLISDIKEAATQADFVARLRKLIPMPEKEFFLSGKEVLHNEAEANRNVMGYAALYANIENILTQAEEEGLSALTFLKERPELSPENPYHSGASETDIKLAADWERIRLESEEVIGKRETFKPSDFLLSSIESLNAYSANINALRAEFANKFSKEISGISTEELLSGWSDAPKGSRARAVKGILDELKDRLRNVAKEYGITYGEIEDHVPQKWAQEKVSSVGFEKFFSDFFPSLDIDRTKKAYNKGLQESLDKAKFDLERIKKDVENLNTLEGNRQLRKSNILLKGIAKTQSKLNNLAAKVDRYKGRKDADGQKRLNYFVKYLAKSESDLEKMLGQVAKYQQRGIIENEKISSEFIERVKKTQSQINDAALDILDTDKIRAASRQSGNDALYNNVSKAQTRLESIIDQLELDINDSGSIKKNSFVAMKKAMSAQNMLNKLVGRIEYQQLRGELLDERITDSFFTTIGSVQDRLYRVISRFDKATEKAGIRIEKGINRLSKSILESNSRVGSSIERAKKNYAMQSRLEEDSSQKLIRQVDRVRDNVNKSIERIELNKTRAIETQAKKGETRIKNATKQVAELEAKVKAPFGENQMRQIYDNIVTDDLLDPSTNTPKPTLNGARRILYFKDISSFEELNRRYGVMPDFRVLVTRDLDSMIRDIARLRAYSGTEEYFTSNVESALKILTGNRELGFWERQLKSILDANISYISGKFARETTMASALGNGYLSLMRNSALGGAGLTAFFDDSHSIAFSGAKNGFGFMRTIGEYLRGITKANLTSEEASRLLVALDDVARGFDDEVYRYPTQRDVAQVANVAQKIDEFTFKVNGVSYLTDRGRVTFNKLFLQELGSLADESNPKMREVLNKYGFNEKDYSAIAEIPLDIDGVPIFNKEFKVTKTYEKVLRALYSENRKAIASTSQSLRAVMASEGYGGRILGVMNSLFFLKRIPMQVFFDRTLLPLYRGEYGDVVKFFAQNLIFTAARLTIKSIAMGYAVDYTSPAFYREVLLQNAAMLPFLQPFFSMDRVDRFNVENALGRSFLGAYAPIVDISQLVTRDIATDVSATRVAKDVHRVIKDFAPLKSHPALGLLYERYIFDNIILAMDPEAYRTLALAEKNRTDSGKIKVF